MNPIATRIVLGVAVAAAKPLTGYLVLKGLQARENRKHSPRKSFRPAKFQNADSADEVIEATIID